MKAFGAKAPVFSHLAAMAAIFCSCGIFDPVELGSHDDFKAEYDLFWATVDRTYVGFIFTDADWQALYDQYLPLVESAATQSDMMAIFQEMLTQFQDAGVVFNGEQTYSPDIQQNVDMDVLWTYLEPAGFTWFQQDIWGACLFDSTAYLMIPEWSSGFIPILFDDFLEAHPGLTGLIVDIRMNDGSGSDLKILEIARRFNDELRVGFYTVGKDGPGHFDLAEPRPRMMYSRANYFTGPIAVLIGSNCGWTSEKFAAAVSNIPAVTMLGDTTMREVGISSGDALHALPACSYIVPDTTLMMADSVTWIQEAGVSPDIFVDATEEQFSQGIDPVLESALDLLSPTR